MSDDLESLLEKPGGTPTHLRLSVSPRVSGGGPSLNQPPKLDQGVGTGGQSRSAHAPHAPANATSQSNGGPSMPLQTHDTQAASLGDFRQTATNQFAPVAGLMSCTGLKKDYYKGSVRIPVLDGVDLDVRQGELLSIVGQSGSGKSTLLHLLGTLDAPDEGLIHFQGQRIDNLPGAGRDTLRNEYFGMIFQFYHLLPEMTMLENVLAPLMISEGVWSYLRNRKKYRKSAVDLLEMVGLGHRLKHKPRELSGGEMQRAAIARALIAEPELLLADEPTGNLDKRSGLEVMEILCGLNRERNLTIVMVTHDPAIADRADRIVRLVDGRIDSAG